LLVAILAANLIHQLAGAAGGQGTHSMTTGLRSVTVRAPARLHLGFLGLSGSMGRRFGSVGLTLDRLGSALTAERAPSFSVSGPQAQRAERFARTLLQRHRLPETCRIAIHATIPEHVGLGSGTQLAIAVGVAVSHLFGLDLPVRDIAALYDRGQRSGIGVGAFEQGGFLVDGGWGTYGFKATTICGVTMAELVDTGRVPELIKPFAVSRFWDRTLVSEIAAAAVSH
jgi:predicted sugar kinase